MKKKILSFALVISILASLFVVLPMTANAETTGEVTTGTGEVTPGTGEVTPGTGEVTPGTGEVTPGTGEVTPGTGEVTPGTGEVTPGTGEVTPGTGEVTPGTGEVTPGTGEVTPGTGEVTPGTGEVTPGTGETTPGTGENPDNPCETGHTWDEGVVTTPATHTEDGVKTFSCEKCDEIKTEVIPADADNHTYGDWVKVDAESHQKTCECGDVVTGSHEWDEGVVILEPTTELEGVKKFTCTVCSGTKTEIIDKVILDYVMGDSNGDEAVDVKDVIALRRSIAGGYGIEVNALAADVNKDGDVDVRDIVILRRYVAGGYDVELK